MRPAAAQSHRWSPEDFDDASFIGDIDIGPRSKPSPRRGRVASKPRLRRNIGGRGLGGGQGMLWLAVAAYIGIQNVPIAGYFTLPIQLLSTFYHELSHCLFAELVGGECVRIQILPFGGGSALSRTSTDLARVIVAAAGLLGPSLIGATILLLSRGLGRSRSALVFLACTLIFTANTWSKDIFTDVLCYCYATFFVLLAMMPGRFLRDFVVQFFAVIFAVDAVEGWSYAMIGGFTREGQHLTSDTGRIAEILGGSHEFWGAIVMAISVAILVAAYFLSSRD